MDDEIVKISEKFLCVYANLYYEKKDYKKLWEQYRASTMEFVFLDPDGKEVSRHKHYGKSTGLKEKLEEVAGKHSRTPPSQEKIIWEEDIQNAAEISITTGKLLAVLFLNDPKDTKATAPLSDKKLSSLLDDYIFFKTTFVKDSDLAKKYKVETAPTLVLVDTIRDRPFMQVKLTVDELAKALTAGARNEVKWIDDPEAAFKEIELKPVLLLFVNDKKESERVKSLLSSRMLAGLITEVTCCKTKSDSVLPGSKITDFPKIVFVTQYTKESWKGFMPGDNTLGSLWGGLKSALSERCEWKCTKKDCNKKADEPGICCGKELEKIPKKGFEEGTEEITIEIKGMKDPFDEPPRLKKGLGKITGVESVEVIYSKGCAVVVVQKRKKDTAIAEIFNLLELRGYKGKIKEER